jgi:heavy metal sensor kinase
MRRRLNFFRRIRVQLTLWYSLALIVFLVAFSALLYFSLKSSLITEVDKGLSNTLGQVASTLDYENGHLAFQNSDEPSSIKNKLKAQGYLVRVVDADGNTLVGAGPYSSVLASESEPEAGYETYRAHGASWRVYTKEIPVSAGSKEVYLQLGGPLDRVESTLSKLLLLELVLIPGVFVLAVLGGLLISGRALKPVKKITSLAASSSAVDLSRRLDLDLPDDEIGMLALTFNDMLDRLEFSFESQKRFVSEAAHELRTPLTVIKGTTDVALSKDRTPAEYQEALGELGTETDHLIGLAEDLLTLSRAESDSAVLKMRDIDLSEVVRNSVERITPIAKEKGIRIEIQGDSSIAFLGDPDKLARLYINLLDNAVRYSPADSKIVVAIRRDGTSATVSVSDEGLGIPIDEIACIFNGFHRLDGAREVNPSGAGLGLSISLWIARAHGGDIHVESQLGKGTTFTVLFPLPQAIVD